MQQTGAAYHHAVQYVNKHRIDFINERFEYISTVQRHIACFESAVWIQIQEMYEFA